MKKRADGEGSIFKRKDGRWVVQFPIPDQPKPLYLYYKSQEEALKKFKELTTAVETDTYVAPTNITLSQYLRDWMIENIEGNVSTNWYMRKMDMIRVHIDPEIGDKEIQKITTKDIKEFYKKLAVSGNKNKVKNKSGEKIVNTGLAPGSIKHIHNILKPAFLQAVEDGIIGYKKNPMKKVKAPQVVKKRKPKTLAEENITKYLEPLSKHRLYAAFVLDLSSGLRRGELLGLHRTDINMENGVLTINTQLQRVKKEEGGSSLVITEILKTDGSARSIVLSPCVLNEVKLHLERQEEEKRKAGALYHDEGLLFCGYLGNKLDTRRLYELHCRALEKSKLEHIRFHDLRHSFATLLLEKGESVKTIQELLGHRDISTTLNTYAHVTQKMKAASAARMEDILSKNLPTAETLQQTALNCKDNELVTIESVSPEPAEYTGLRLVVNNNKITGTQRRKKTAIS